MFHDVLHPNHTAFAFKRKAVLSVYINTIFLIQVFSCLHHGNALCAVISSHFTDEHGCNNGILIPNVRASQITIAFFKAKDIAVFFALFFQETNLFADELEARQNFNQFYTISLADCFYNVSGNDGLYCNRMLRHRALLNTLFADIFQQHCTNFITGEQCISALSIRNGDANTVSVWVSCQQQIRLYLVAVLQTELQCFPNFRVRIRTGGKVAVWIFLFLDNGHFLNADAVQNGANRLVSSAVQRGVDNLQTAFCT